MRTVQCFVLIIVSFCVGGIQVSSDWNQDQGHVNDFGFEGSSGHRFGARKPQPGLGQAASVRNEQAKPLLAPTISYNPFQSNQLDELKPKPATAVDPNSLLLLPQIVEPKTNLPPLLNPRYPVQQPIKNPTQRKYKLAYEQPEILAQNHNEALVLPSDILRIKPAIIGIPGIDKYRQLKDSQVKQDLLNQKYNSEVHKEYAITPTARLFDLYATNKPLQQPLGQQIIQNNKFLVPATKEGLTPKPLGFQVNQNIESIEFTTKNEPVFLVTEGYRNVLLQGPSKQKEYIRSPAKDESKTFVTKEKLENRSDVGEQGDDESAKVPTKKANVYIPHENEGKGSNLGGSSKNLVEGNDDKPNRYFESSNNDGKSSLENKLTNNYRDDRLHEPSEDFDSERDDDDKEKISDDDDDEFDDIEDDEENSETQDVDNTKPDNTESSSDDIEEEDDDDDDDDFESDEEEEPEDEADEEKVVPHSEHADPKPIPSKPIYPGEGQWAKPGVKHRPYVSQHRFVKPIEDERKPDGYDVFEDLEQFFDKEKDKFGNNFGKKTSKKVNTAPSTQNSEKAQSTKSPNAPNPIVVFDPFNEHATKKSEVVYKEPYKNTATASPNKDYITRRSVNTPEINQQIIPNNQRRVDNIDETEDEDEDEESEEEAAAEEEFVPVRIYTQVRNSENVAHEPRNPEEHGRLKELVKDSKVQTVYSEEGYEDSAYDHAGHEKKAEEDQGYAGFEKEKEEQNKAKPPQENDSDRGHSKKVIVADKPLVDSIASESVHRPQPELNNSEDLKGNKISKSGNTNNFMASQELKRTQVKDKDNGDVQLEIESEVKVIVQPNNSTKAHKYVKIYPKLLKDISKKPEGDKELSDKADDALIASKAVKDNDGSVNQTSIYQQINEMAVSDSSTTESSTVSNIESITKNIGSSTSEQKPKVTVKVLDNDGTLKKITEESSKTISRKKRSSDDSFEDVNIDEEFIELIDKVNHTFAPPVKPKLDVQKYPYYVRPNINQNSPLRYAENMENIPKKQEGELSFYKMAEKMECPDLPQDINPVAEHEKHSRRRKREAEEQSDDENEDGDEEGEDEEEESVVDQKHRPTPKSPRIHLGDKIDCLKVRYFGENPLDSPFFKEETVGPVLPIFKALDRNANQIKDSSNQDNSLKSTATAENVHSANEIFNQIGKKNERNFKTEVKDKIFNTLEESAKIDENINTNSKRDTNAKINTLYSIENDKAESIRSNTRFGESPLQDKNAIRAKKPTPSPVVTLITTPKYTIQLTPNNIYDQIKLLDHLPEDDVEEETVATTKRPATTTVKQEIEERKETVTESVQKKIEPVENKRKSKILIHVDDENEENKKVNEVISSVAEPEALRRRKLRPRLPVYEIFDVSKFLTTTPFSVIQTAASNVLPKYKVVSEVFYKDEIKPNEQLTVFADVLNNIKNSSYVEPLPIEAASDFAEPNAVTISPLDDHVTASPKIQHSTRVKKFQTDSSNQQNVMENDRILANKENVLESYNVPKRYRPGLSNTVNRRPNQALPADQPVKKLDSRKIRRKPSTSTTSTTLRTTMNVHIPNQKTPNNHKPYVIDYIEDTDEVIGLVPPQNFQYRTIVVDDSEVRDTNNIPEEVYDYQTIQPVDEEIINHQPAPVTEINDEVPTKRPLNKYYFLGLKPPAHKKARPYSDFNHNNIDVNNNLLRRRVAHIGLARSKRSATRPAYADVSRNRGAQNSDLTKASASEDDVEDYVPHRPKNYHYDEKTGKIIYHNKQEKPEEEEVEYEEIEVPDTPGIYLERAEDATHPTPEKVTTKQLLATATPPPEGQGLLDFVVKLKNNPSYKYIPDPTTPKPGSVSSTTEAFVTVDPKSTNPPEFLSILSKVKTDKTYKYIEDPKGSESQTKTKSTTPQAESEEEYADDDEEEEDDDEEDAPGSKKHSRTTRQADNNFKIFNIGDFLPKIQTPTSSNIPTSFFKTHVVDRLFPRLSYLTPYDIAREQYKQTVLYKFIKNRVQNSPGGQNRKFGNLQIFNIGDYLPNIEPVTPKTTIDYSKYKTIERPHTRHNISSKYNYEEGQSSEEGEVISRPPPAAEAAEAKRSEAIEEKESVVSDKKVEAGASTTQRIVQSRRGTRPTTQKTTAETAESIESASTRRNANRRRPSVYRGKPTSTTEIIEGTEHIEKIYPERQSTERAYSDTNDKAKRVYRKRPVRIRYTTERQEEDDDTVERIVRRSIDPDLADVKNQFEKEYLDDRIIEEKYDDIKDEIINDEKDRVKIGDADIGDEASESKKREVVEKSLKDVEVMNKNYDKTKKHGGNYRRENEEEESEKDSNEEQGSEQVEGRNVKEDDNKKEATVNENKKNNVEIVNKNYDKQKKHGGNYHRESEEEDEEAEAVQDETEAVAKVVEDENRKFGKLLDGGKKDVDIINKKYDKTKKHGGNYKSEEDAVIDELLETAEETQQNEDASDQTKEKTDISANKEQSTINPEKIKGRGRTKFVSPITTSTEIPKELPRLSDISPKPDHFYSDSQLPKQVNKLGSEKPPIKLASEEIDQIAAEGDLNEKIEKPDPPRSNLRRRKYDEDDEIKNDDKGDEDKSVSTKKPLFIKDPSKRLYYYASV